MRFPELVQAMTTIARVENFVAVKATTVHARDDFFEGMLHTALLYQTVRLDAAAAAAAYADLPKQHPVVLWGYGLFLMQEPQEAPPECEDPWQLAQVKCSSQQPYSVLLVHAPAQHRSI